MSPNESKWEKEIREKSDEYIVKACRNITNNITDPYEREEKYNQCIINLKKYKGDKNWINEIISLKKIYMENAKEICKENYIENIDECLTEHNEAFL